MAVVAGWLWRQRHRWIEKKRRKAKQMDSKQTEIPVNIYRAATISDWATILID